MNALLGRELRDLYAGESGRIREAFRANGNGRQALLGRTSLVESIALRLWPELISFDTSGPRGFALVALGGFGELSPSAITWTRTTPSSRYRFSTAAISLAMRAFSNAFMNT